MLYRKAPDVATLPPDISIGMAKPKFWQKFSEILSEHHFNIFEKQEPLHKFLVWLQPRIRKLQGRVDGLLHGVKQKAAKAETKTRKKNTMPM